MTTLPPIRTGTARSEFGHIRPLADDIEIPFGIIEGAQPGPCLLVTAGVHGSEYCSIETALRLLKLSPERIKGTLIVLPILNLQGFHKRSIYVMPQDGKNLNRMFPGDAAGTISQRLAHWLTTSVYPLADAYIDLHGGDLDEGLAPFTIYPRACEKSRALAEAFGLPVIVASGGAGYTLDAAHQLGIPGILPEVSGNGLWDEDTVGMMSAGVHRVMHKLGLIDAAEPVPAGEQKVVTMWVPKAPVSGLWYPAKTLSEPVAEGEVIGEIRDAFGKVLASIRSEKAGFILYRLTSLAVNQDEALLGVGTLLEE